MTTRKASIKETGEELSPADWARFDAAVAEEKAQRPETEPYERDEVAAKRRDGKDLLKDAKDLVTKDSAQE